MAAVHEEEFGVPVSPSELEQMERDEDQKPPINPEMASWLEDVDDITSRIDGMMNGTVDPHEVDKWYEKKLVMKEIKNREEKEAREKAMRMGRSGYGEKENGYKWWCRGCHTEFFIDLEGNQCWKCGKDLVAQADRRAELMGKLEDAKKEKVARNLRRDKWTRWKKSQRLLNKSKNIDYKKWEFWEPESDDEEAEPIVPKDDPQFMAMEADMQQRKQKMEAKTLTANKCKERGNECLKANDFIGAIDHYKNGLEFRKDVKPLWTNKALAELKIGRFADAVESAGKVIEYCEIFEEGFQKSKDIAFKAFIRRSVHLMNSKNGKRILQSKNIWKVLSVYHTEQEH
jgi:tetratricopeptide (TPR) repeat protein